MIASLPAAAASDGTRPEHRGHRLLLARTHSALTVYLLLVTTSTQIQFSGTLVGRDSIAVHRSKWARCMRHAHKVRVQ